MTSGKELVCFWGFSEAFFLLPSSRFRECQQCLLGLVPQHDSWHDWCSAHCLNSEKSTRQLPHFLFLPFSHTTGIWAGWLASSPSSTDLWWKTRKSFRSTSGAYFTEMFWHFFCVMCGALSHRKQSSCRSTSNFSIRRFVGWHTLVLYNSVCCPIEHSILGVSWYACAQRQVVCEWLWYKLYLDCRSWPQLS